MPAHYECTEDGMSIFGSFEKFNRVLYGGHDGDRTEQRFFTFAGDTPIFMGASSDYTRNTWCYQAKNGVLLSGLALTPGHVEAGAHDFFLLVSRMFRHSRRLASWKHELRADPFFSVFSGCCRPH